MKSRKTIQNDLVLDAVRTLSCHATAEEVYNYIIKTHPTISKGTVYRNLSSLAEEGQIMKIEIPDDADCFDHQCHRHYHIKCIKCGRVFDVDMDFIPDITDMINDRHGFDFIEHDILFKGICPDCKKGGI